MSFKLSGGSPTVEVSASASVNNNYSNTQAQVTVTANSWMVYSGSWVQSSGVVAKATGNGSSLGTKTIFGNGTKTEGTSVHSVTFTFLVNKGTSAKNISWSVNFHSYIDGTDLGCKDTKSGTVSVSAKPSYTVSYNANGGSGAPGNQTKWYGTTLALSSTKPTRTGYSFKNWNTKSDGTGTSYASGANYTGNAALTLYAQWTANTYTVSYNANGGSGAPSSQTKTYGINLTLSSTKPTRTNYNFLGWATSSTGSVAYAAGATYSANSAVTLYAVWELAYWKPKITNLTATRCDSDGTANEYGTYAKITFNWELCQLIGTNTTATIAISWTGSSTSVTVTGSGTSGTVSKVVGSGALSIESPYTFTVKVTDNTDNTSLDVTLPASSFAIDFKAGGTGVNFGAPAEEDGFSCEWSAGFYGNIRTTFKKQFDRDTSNAHTIVRGYKADGETTQYHISAHNTGGSGSGALILTPHTPAEDFWSMDEGLYIAENFIKSPGTVRMPNSYGLSAANTSGTYRNLAFINSNNNTYFGNGSYANSEGSTYYQGSTVGIQAKGHIYMTAPSAGLSARAFGVNKVLWSGGAYMDETQTITLSEAISAQPNGIVLSWCWYQNGTAANYDWVHNFIPKYHIAAQLNNGFQCAGFGVDGHMAKYLYPTDTTLRGYSYNDATTEVNGVTFYNAHYVLRYVIGV